MRGGGDRECAGVARQLCRYTFGKELAGSGLGIFALFANLRAALDQIAGVTGFAEHAARCHGVLETSGDHLRTRGRGVGRRRGEVPGAGQRRDQERARQQRVARGEHEIRPVAQARLVAECRQAIEADALTGQDRAGAGTVLHVERGVSRAQRGQDGETGGRRGRIEDVLRAAGSHGEFVGVEIASAAQVDLAVDTDIGGRQDHAFFRRQRHDLGRRPDGIDVVLAGQIGLAERNQQALARDRGDAAGCKIDRLAGVEGETPEGHANHAIVDDVGGFEREIGTRGQGQHAGTAAMVDRQRGIQRDTGAGIGHGANPEAVLAETCRIQLRSGDARVGTGQEPALHRELRTTFHTDGNHHRHEPHIAGAHHVDAIEATQVGDAAQVDL